MEEAPPLGVEGSGQEARGPLCGSREELLLGALLSLLSMDWLQRIASLWNQTLPALPLRWWSTLKASWASKFGAWQSTR